MKPAALDRKLGRDLWRMRGQLLAISLVIASGISTFVMSRSTFDSLEVAMGRYYSQYRFADGFTSLVRAPERVRDKLAAIPGVGVVDTRIVAAVTLDVEDVPESVVGQLVSLPDLGEPRLNSVHLRFGRMPEEGRDKEILVSEPFAEANGLRVSDTLSAILNERREELRIVGIALAPEYLYSIKPGSIFPDDRLFGVLWMRRRALAAAFDMEGAFNDVSFRLIHDASPEEVLARVDAVLEPYGGRGAYLRKEQQSHWYLENEFDELQATGAFLPTVFLGVAAFLLNVVLSRMVRQQRDQIAVLKAFGYGNLRVGLHYGQMAAVVVAAAGLLGIAGGAWMGRAMLGIYAEYFRFPDLRYVLDLRYFLQAFAIGAAAAALGALTSIRSAVRLPPAEAMRPEAPASYRPALVERAGLRRWLSMPARMVLRSVERRPLKSALTVFGIACGVALLVVGNGMMDSVRHAMEFQFFFAQREDMTVNLVEPRSLGAAHELAGFPGVLRAEPFRAVAARLEGAHRSRRVAVMGLPQDADLHRLLDADGAAITMPGDGLVLTDKLAEVMRVRPGDSVVMKVLEGRQPTLEVPVSAVAESFIGMGAYMSMSALNARMDEGPVLSGANLLLDEARVDAFHRAVKGTPGIAAASSRKDAYRSFEETAAETMRVLSLFMVLFAVIIACGVVYNSARILLAERSRELASMRVLGYRRREISAILLGELWLFAALAIPVGCFLGLGLTASVVSGMDSELYRMPLVVRPATYGFAGAVVGAAAIVSGLLVRRRLDRLDLVAVLKTRE